MAGISSGGTSAIGGVAAAFITPTPIAAAGSTRTLDMGSEFQKIVDLTLDQTLCTLTFTGFTADGKNRSMFVRVVGHSGRNVAFADTFNAKSYGALPVFSTSGITEFEVFSEGAGDLNLSHGQMPRTIVWGPGNAGTTVTAVSSPDFPVFNDARIVDGVLRLTTAGTSQATKVDVNVNGSTIYTTAGNRPTVAALATSSGAITLPDTTLLTPGQRISFDIDQFGTSAAGLIMALRFIEAG